MFHVFILYNKVIGFAAAANTQTLQKSSEHTLNISTYTYCYITKHKRKKILHSTGKISNIKRHPERPCTKVRN